MDDEGELDEKQEAATRDLVEKALGEGRELLTPEEVEDHRRMLTFLARTHPSLSTWIEDQRPRAVPDESGMTEKKDTATLQAAVQRRAGEKRQGK